MTCTESGLNEAFFFALNSSCLINCPEGFYKNSSDHVCHACSLRCQLCFDNSTFCQQCTESGLDEAFLLDSDSSCLSECPTGFFENRTDHTCDVCHGNCESCSENATFCSKCTSTGVNEAFFYSQNSSCLEVCPDGFYKNITDHSCYACDEKCEICS